MSAPGEEGVAAVEQPAPEVPAAEEPKQQAEKPVKEKKPRAPKEKKPKEPKTAAHPPYFEMIKEALLALNEKSGSSPYAIAKYMEEKHRDELPSNYKKILALQLKNSASRGKLIKIKASYKLSESGKKDKPAKAQNTETKPKPKQKPKSQPKETTKASTRARARARAAAKKPDAGEKISQKRKVRTKKIAPAPKKAKKSTPAKPKQPKSIKSPSAKRARKAAA